MKKTIITCLSLALFSSMATAQTKEGKDMITKHYDKIKIHDATKEMLATRQANLIEAYRLAEKNDWPLRIDYEDGSFADLIGVHEGKYPMYVTTQNKGGVSTIHADKVHTGGEMGLELNGEDMLVGVWDANTVLLTHELFEGRALKGDNMSSTHSHSTHVTGTIIGSKEFKEGNAVGVAHKAEAITYDWNNDLEEMINEAEEGLLVSNHSYGAVTITDSGQAILPVSMFGQYNSSSRFLDLVLNELEYYLPVYAAGNDRDYYYLINEEKNGFDLLTNESNSKNNIVVASAWEVVDYQIPYDVHLSSFSNYGPTDDGRVKPDITAKGHNVYSSVNSYDSAYSTFSGTSMSAPSITGGIALLQQHSWETHDYYLRSASIRGLIAHTAYKAGVEGNPNYRYGWGVMDVAEAVHVISEANHTTRLDELVLENGQVYMTTVVSSGEETLVGTIAWNDLPGTISYAKDDRTPKLINDLDIRIISEDGLKNYPFILRPEVPTAGPLLGNNIRDNIEKIEILAPEGAYNVVVSHKGGLQGEDANQKFTLILSGLAEQNFTLETFNNDLSFCENTTDEASIKVYVRGENLTENFNFNIENLPAGVTATVNDDNLTTDNYFEVNLEGISELDLGDYRFDVIVMNNNNEEKISPIISITVDDFEAVNLVSPVNGKDEVYGYVEFKWEPSDNFRVQSYVLEVSMDANFEDIVHTEEGITEASFMLYGVIENKKDYYWRVKAVGECGDGEWSSTFTFHTYNLSVVDVEREESLNIYPNPTSDILNIQAVNTIEKIELYNILGQLVLEQNPSKADVQLNLAGLARGNYILKVKDSEGTTIKKIVLN